EAIMRCVAADTLARRQRFYRVWRRTRFPKRSVGCQRIYLTYRGPAHSSNQASPVLLVNDGLWRSASRSRPPFMLDVWSGADEPTSRVSGGGVTSWAVIRVRDFVCLPACDDGKMSRRTGIAAVRTESTSCLA